MECTVGRRVHLFIKHQLGPSLVLAVKEHGSLQTKLWDEHNNGVLPDEQDEALLIEEASALEEQLGGGETRL